MRIAVAATPEVAIPTLESLLTSGHEISVVITQPDAPQGRGRELAQTPVAHWAADKKILLVKAATESDVRSAISGTDLLIAIGFGRILSEETINTPKFGSINLHFSLLPAYRGAAPAQRALLSGDDKTGVTVFALNKGLDAGPIYTQIECLINDLWTGVELLAKLAEIGAEATLKAIEMIQAGEKPAQQNETLASHAPKITRDELGINWTKSAREISLQVRAFSPAVFTRFRGESFKITFARLADIVKPLQPGEILIEGKEVYAGTPSGLLHLKEVVPSGKKPMDAYSWANGARLATGEKFE